MGQNDLALIYYEIALRGKWDERFGDFRQIVGLEYLQFLREVATEQRPSRFLNYSDVRLSSILAEFDPGQVDLMVTIMWNRDRTDVDLHVVEPTGEECYYGHNQTILGGRITRDVTQGYGPEMYVLPKALNGKYKIDVNYFGSDRAKASARCKIYATVVRRWGEPNQKTTRKVVTLVEGKDRQPITVLEVE